MEHVSDLALALERQVEEQAEAAKQEIHEYYLCRKRPE